MLLANRRAGLPTTASKSFHQPPKDLNRLNTDLSPLGISTGSAASSGAFRELSFQNVALEHRATFYKFGAPTFNILSRSHQQKAHSSSCTSRSMLSRLGCCRSAGFLTRLRIDHGICESVSGLCANGGVQQAMISGRNPRWRG